MLVVNLLYELIALGEGILRHFITGSAGTPIPTADKEWVFVGAQAFTLSPKGNYLSGAVADILVYGAILVDWIVQSLLNFNINASVL